MSNKVYDYMKIASLVIVPLIAFVSALLAIWDIPYQTQISASLSALDVFIGSLVTVASASYKKKIDEEAE